MKITKSRKESVSIFHAIALSLADKLPPKIKPFFLSLLGALLSVARRHTVTAWLQAAQIEDDFRQAPSPVILYHMPNVGRKSQKLFNAMMEEILNSKCKRKLFFATEVTETHGRTQETCRIAA